MGKPAEFEVAGLEWFVVKYSGSLTVGATGVGRYENFRGTFAREKGRWTSEESKEAVSTPDVNYDCGTNSEECVSDDFR